MEKKTLIIVLLCCFALFAGCMLFVHRRVIKAVMKGEPIPQAPAWHFWVKNRKDS